MKKYLLLLAGVLCSLCMEAQAPKLIKDPNDPVGVPQGIHPGRDGTSLKSLGLCEHWNNGTDKSYTKIDLVYKKK